MLAALGYIERLRVRRVPASHLLPPTNRLRYKVIKKRHYPGETTYGKTINCCLSTVILSSTCQRGMSQRLKDFLSIACMMSGLDTSALVVGIGAVEGHHGYVPSPSSLNNGLPPVASTLEHDEYVSLGISRDSDEDRKKSVYHQTTKVCRLTGALMPTYNLSEPPIVVNRILDSATRQSLCSDYERGSSAVKNHCRYPIAESDTGVGRQRH